MNLPTSRPAHDIDVAASAYDYPLLIKHLLHTPMATALDQEVVYRDTVRLSYRELFQRIARLAEMLRLQGVKAGDTVAMMDWDSHRYLEAYFAIPMMGAVLMTVNVRLSPEQIAYTLNHSGAGTLLINSEFLPMLDAIAKHVPGVKRCILIDEGETAPPAGFVGGYEELIASVAEPDAPLDLAFPDFDERTRATTFYTTGTTGDPKGVYFSHRQLVLHSLGAASMLGTAPHQGRVHRDDVYMPITPMFHVHAWGVPFVATMLGLKQVYPGRYSPEMLLSLKAREKVTFSHCVPTILHMLLSAPGNSDVDMQGWKMIIGGSALPKGLARQALERGIDIFTGYGMSETCPVLTLAQVPTSLLDDTEAELDIRTRTGRPLPLVDLRVVDEEMQDRPHDGRSAGEVVVRAPWLTQGYFRNPEASESLWAGGYLHTHDIGVIHPDGFLQITDRIKDVIKTGGEWVSSLQLEDLISRHPAVSEAAVIGVPDPKWGERPMALITLKPGAQLDTHALREHLVKFVAQGEISRYAVPERVLFVDSIDKTSVGKINKRVLRERHLG